MISILGTLLYAVVTGFVGLVTALIVYARWHYGTLEKVKGLNAIIKPAFIGGSDPQIHNKIVHEEDSKNVKTLGKIYGYYEGRAPHIYIADPEMIRLIFIKDFENFHNKRIMDFGHELINEMLDILPYDKWKVVRSFISPSLTTGKIRNMSVAMTEAIDDWMETAKDMQSKADAFYPKKMYTALTSDVIARCAFGTKLNSLHDPDNVFVKNLKLMGLDGHDVNFLLSVSHTLPFLARLTPFFPTEPLIFFGDILKTVMKERRDRNLRVNDFVDTLNDMMAKLETEEYKKMEITEITIMCQALIFFLAGFETTASTLTYLTYNLAKYPEIQDKLIAEVDSFLARHNGKVEHENILELVYMSACIQETLRMFPPLIRVERVCNKDWYHEPTGLHVPKDMVIQVPIPSIHYNEEYYPDPYQFKPERFLPENKDQLNPYAFLSFGLGNHNCIGMRFAKEEMLLVMANVLKNFTFKETSDTKLSFLPGRTFIMTPASFSVETVKRY